MSVQAARGMAALMVMVFHAKSIDAKYFAGGGILPPWLTFGQTGVDLFFVISGFVMVLTSWGMSGPYEATSFIRDRLGRIYPTYWVYCVALLGVYLVAPTAINSSQGGRIDFVSSIFLLPSGTLPLLLVAWSLTLELWFYGVLAIAISLRLRSVVLLAVIWGLTIGLCAAIINTPSNPALRVIVHPFALEFIAGALIGAFFKSSLSKRIGTWFSGLFILLGLFLLAAAATTDIVNGSDVIASVALPRVGLVGGGFTSLLAGLVLIERGGLTGPFAYLQKLGDMSYTLYLSHILSLNIFARMWRWMTAGRPVPVAAAVAYWVATFIACLALAWLAYRRLERPLMRLVRSRSESGLGHTQARA
ncbi:acyltransferase family protein [Achromobacter aloeverae]